MLVVLDADVLVPILTCDLLLTAAEAGLIQPIWSATILDEVRRNLIAIHPEIEPARLERRVQLMVDAFPDALVEGWEQQTESVPVNPKDRHVLGVAKLARAERIVTNDSKLRTQLERADEIPGISLDEFAINGLAEDPEGWRTVVATLVTKRRNPPIDRDQFLTALAIHVPGFITNPKLG